MKLFHINCILSGKYRVILMLEKCHFLLIFLEGALTKVIMCDLDEKQEKHTEF
jgi:hypothetical protein